MQSYDYSQRAGVRALSWEDCAALAAQLVEQIAPFQPDCIVGVARAGLFPATMVALNLRRDLYPVRISRRINDEVRYQSPIWHVPVSDAVKGKRVVVVDEIADTGDSLEIVRQAVEQQGASAVISACLVRHTWAKPEPFAVGLISDELIVFPWDRQVYIDGVWQPHPEIVSAIESQKQA
jgi:hypoxanthine phosphoribosyltransferase